MPNQSIIGIELNRKNIRIGKIKNGKIVSENTSKISSKSSNKSAKDIVQNLINSIIEIYSNDVAGIGISVLGWPGRALRPTSGSGKPRSREQLVAVAVDEELPHLGGESQSFSLPGELD